MYENNEYFKCFRVLYHIMKIFGIFPFLFSHKGTSKHLYISRIITCFSVIFFIMSCAEQYVYVNKNVTSMLVNFRFDFFIRVLPPVSSRIIYLFLPFITWRGHKKIYIHLEKWQKLQDTLTRIQKAPYSSPSSYIISSINIIILAIALPTLIPLKKYFDLNSTVSTGMPSFIFLQVVFLTTLLYWLSDCLFVIFVAKDIFILIKNSITSSDENKFIRLVKFWVDWYEWNGEFSSTLSIGFLLIFANIIIILVACFYTFTFIIVVEEDKIASLAYLFFASASIIILLIFFESANFLTKQIASVVPETMLSMNTSRMNMRLLAVMLAFLQTIEARKPKIMLNGVLIVNRSSILPIFAIIINFLIVLRQFNTQ